MKSIQIYLQLMCNQSLQELDQQQIMEQGSLRVHIKKTGIEGMTLMEGKSSKEISNTII